MSQRAGKSRRGGSKAPAKEPPKEPEATPERQLRPHKIVGQLVGVILNEKGEIVGEDVMGPVTIFKAQFGEVDSLIEDAYNAAVEEGR